MSKRKVGTIASNQILKEAYSDKNAKNAEDVSLGETTEYYFICNHCEINFKKAPNDFNRRKAPLYPHSIYCGGADCRKRVFLLNKKQHFLQSSKPSFRAAQPLLADEFISFTDPIAQELRTLDDVPEFCQLEGNWQCKQKDYHKWVMKLSGRSANPQCPYCPTGDKTHFLDSIYQYLSKKDWLNYLDPKDHERAKMKKIGTTEKFNFICKHCSKTQQTSFNSFVKSEGCTACMYSEEAITNRKKKRIRNGEKSVDDYPEFAKEYCYDQPGIPENKRNKICPADMPISYQPVFWQCKRGHITSASPKSRIIDGAICKKCGSQTSRMECIVFTELKTLLSPFGYQIFHRFENEKYESDIFIITPLQEQISIEIDGTHYHSSQKKLKQDIKKDEFHQSKHIRTLRIRERPLEPLHSTQKTLVTDFCDYLGAMLFIINDLNDTYSANLDIPQSMQHQDQGNHYYTTLYTVPYEESVGYLFPQLVELVDYSRTTLSLYNVRASSDVQFPWLDKPGGKFLKWDKISNRIRNNKLTTPKELCNQAVTEENCLAVTHPQIAHCFVDPTNFVSGTGQRVDTYCCYPHTIDQDGHINTHGKEHICGVITKRLPSNVIKQIKNKNACWNIRCNHEGHRNNPFENIADIGKHNKKINAKKRKAMLREELGSLLQHLPLFVIKSLLKANPVEITCPDCQNLSYRGTKKEAIAKLKEQNGYECYWCFGSGLPLDKELHAYRKKILEHKRELLEFEHIHSNWKINRKLNKYGLTLEPINESSTIYELKINLISPQGHHCQLPLNKLSQFDSSDHCICPSCVEKDKEVTKEKRNKEQGTRRRLTISSHIYISIIPT